MSGPGAEFGLLGDIGATNARFALAQPDGAISIARVYALNDYTSLFDALDAYLCEEEPPAMPSRAALAVASPITSDDVALTNHAWEFSIAALRQHFRLHHLCVVNDFLATALAVPHLARSDRLQIGPGTPANKAPIGVIGPGTGLGVGALLSASNGAVALASEGGHVTMSPANAQESAVLDLMRRRYDHVSAERLLSGPGLINLYNALCELAGVPAAPFAPAQITNSRIWNEDLRTREATMMFCAMLGTVAGNLALTLGARGGVYIAGGIVPALGAVFAESEFRRRFEDKGRMRGYLAPIPTYLVTRPLPALVGAAALLRESATNGPGKG
jgi:glucokinase